MAELPCRTCGKLGHWSRECPQNPKNPKTGKGQAGGQVHVVAFVLTEPGLETPRASLADLLQSFVTPASARSEYKEPALHAAYTAGQNGRTSVGTLNMAGQMTIDIGCLCTVAGAEWAVSQADQARKEGRFMEM